MTRQGWNEKVFFHGTDNQDFEKFDPKMIGSAHDNGWYGNGFYFAFSEGEASYYGYYVRKAKLNILNPFFFTEELLEMDGQHTNIVGDLALFAIRLTEKFPELAKNLTLSVVTSFNENGTGNQCRIPFPEYAQKVLEVYNGNALEIFPCYGKEVKFRYKYNDNYNCLKDQFDTIEYAQMNRLNVAATYVDTCIYKFVDGHAPEYFMQKISELFTAELKQRGYDGIIQSEVGDEIICFDPDQVMWL